MSEFKHSIYVLYPNLNTQSLISDKIYDRYQYPMHLTLFVSDFESEQRISTHIYICIYPFISGFSSLTLINNSFGEISHI